MKRYHRKPTNMTNDIYSFDLNSDIYSRSNNEQNDPIYSNSRTSTINTNQNHKHKSINNCNTNICNRQSINQIDDEPDINIRNDNIQLTSTNYKPNQALMNLTGFDELTPFMGDGKSKSVSSMHDNSFNDYNEEGNNNINESSYRQMLIKQMTDSVFQQSHAMFGDYENSNKSSRRNPENQYDVDNTYTPSKAPSLYLQKQSKRIFRDSGNLK